MLGTWKADPWVNMLSPESWFYPKTCSSEDGGSTAFCQSPRRVPLVNSSPAAGALLPNFAVLTPELSNIAFSRCPPPPTWQMVQGHLARTHLPPVLSHYAVRSVLAHVGRLSPVTHPSNSTDPSFSSGCRLWLLLLQWTLPCLYEFCHLYPIIQVFWICVHFWSQNSNTRQVFLI